MILTIFEIICACSGQKLFALIMFCSPVCKVGGNNFVTYVFFFQCYGAKVTGHSPVPMKIELRLFRSKQFALIMFCSPVYKVRLTFLVKIFCLQIAHTFVANIFLFKCYSAKVTGHSPASSCLHENRAAPIQVKISLLF